MCKEMVRTFTDVNFISNMKDSKILILIYGLSFLGKSKSFFIHLFAYLIVL